MAIKHLSDLNPDGTVLGQSSADLVAFHGATPIAKASLTCLVSTATMVSMNLWLNDLVLFLRNKGLAG